MNNLTNVNDALKNLSEEERELALSILKQMAADGQSALFDDLKYSDFEEIPVDIDTFLDDDRYLGRGIWAVDEYSGQRRCTLFPYWRETLHKIFPDNLTTACNTLILTGCLGYDTPIPLLNGRTEKIGDLAKTDKLDEYVYSYDINTNSYVPGHLIKAFSTGVKPVYEITLDNGQKIKATSNHKFMTRDKHWKSIDTGLAVGDSMMPFNTKTGSIADRDGYEIIENPNKDGTTSDIFTHRLVMSWKIGEYSGVVHHKDYNKLNNDPRNLQLMTWQAHKMFHAKRGGMQWQAFNEKRRLGLISPELEQKIRDGALLGNKNRWADENEHKKMSALTTNRMNNGLAKEMANIVWNGSNADLNRQKVINNIVTANTDPKRIEQYQISKAIKVGNLAIKDFCELTKDSYEQTKLKYNMRSGYPSFEAILNRISLQELTEQAAAYNHKIIKIEFIGNEEVFDLTVEKYHNFAIKDGIVAHNSIGLGKTLMAVLCMLYLLYRMLCLKDPYSYYGMMPSDKITFAMLNITLDAAQGVGWDKLQQLVQSSDWFMTHGELNASRTNPQWQPPKGIELIFGSNNRHVVGRALFSNFTDECNFGVGNDVEKKKEKQKKMIAQIDARMVSRFGKGNFLPTLNIIASSKDTEQAFLESYIDTKKKNDSKSTLIIDEPQWIVRNDKGTPEDPGSFWVAVGGKFLAHELLPVDATDELVDSFRAKGYQMLKIPPIYREDFETNLEQALMDDAGISTSSATKYISGIRLNQAKVDTYQNPFTKDVIEVGNSPEDHYQYANFFDTSTVSAEDKARPMFIHLDMSTGAGGRGDKTGIAGVWITGKQPTTADNPDISRDLRFKLAFSVSIKAPKGYQISFEKNRNFIRWLRDQGFAIKGISSDTFQSATLLQELKSDGFNTEIISVDRVDATSRTCLPYHFLQSAIYERKIEIYQKCDQLTNELVGLERKADGHIDHTADGINSKDQADAVCGATYLASKFAEEYSYQYGDNLVSGLNVSLENNSDDYKRQQMLVNFEEELAKLNMNNIPDDPGSLNKQNEEYKRYMDIADGIIVL